MRETCQKCNRPTTKQHTDSLYDGNVCGQHPYDPRECKVAAVAFRRGVLAARDVVMEHIYVGKDGRGMWFSQEPTRGRYANGKTVMYPTIVIDRFIQDVDRAREEVGE